MKLAINGGNAIREKDDFFPRQTYFDKSEKNNVRFTMESEKLSAFRGNAGKHFNGGPWVREFEKKWTQKFNVKHSITVNSATSGLQIACIAVGLKPGDEVIVTPWSMSCSATAPLICGAKPVFVDIEKDYFCIDPKKIEERITGRTRAIIVVDLFGQPYSHEINTIAKKYNLWVIEDAAQAPGSYYFDTTFCDYAGTLGDIGVFSFTQGKHMTAGEGGMLTTNNDELAERCKLLRNHADAVYSDDFYNKNERLNCYKASLYGFNMRMTELQAAILYKQLDKLDSFIEQRERNVEHFKTICDIIPPLMFSKNRELTTHSYYVAAMHWNNVLSDDIERDVFVEAVKAELTEEKGRPDKGVPIGCGYIRPLYEMPIFKINEISVCNNNFCETADYLQEKELIITTLHALPLTEKDNTDIKNAFIKVWENKKELRTKK